MSTPDLDHSCGDMWAGNDCDKPDDWADFAEVEEDDTDE